MTPFDILKEACSESLTIFTKKAFGIIEPGKPYEHNWHVDCICEHLQAVQSGEIKDLIINLPPRLLKSVLVAQIFPAWLLLKDPSHQLIGASYVHTLAEKNVMASRRIITSDFYQKAYPQVVLAHDNNRKDFFTTTANGQYKGTGIGGTITGFGADTLIIDDPINPKEAASDAVRMVANEEIALTLFSRFNDIRRSRTVLIMQRLHEDDPTGRLLSFGGYHHLKLPAQATTRVQVKLGNKEWTMEPGELLSPRLPEADLDSLRLKMGEYNFSGQYSQEPVPVGGGEFKSGWIGYYDKASVRHGSMNVVILCDPAGGDDMNRKKKKLSDWTAFMVVGLAPDNNYYWLDAVRDRLNPTERVDTLFMLHRKWNTLCGKPPKVGYEKYGMMTDTHYIRDKMRKEAYNFSLTELGGNVSKEERIRRLIPDMQNGRWFFPHEMLYVDGLERRFDLVKEIVDGEMATFPRSKFDDMIDALSRVYEAELNLVFPAPKKTMVQSAYASRGSSGGDWKDF